MAESQPIETRVALSDLTDSHVAMLAEQGVSREALERALRPVLDKKAEIAAVGGAIQARRSEITQIERDQGRLRDNIEALGGSAEERALVQRYTRRLGQQEDRLETLRREIDDLEERRRRLDGELREMIERAAAEIDAED